MNIILNPLKVKKRVAETPTRSTYSISLTHINRYSTISLRKEE